ncbi:MAG: ArsA-related P-loop ATPase, partial [Myxococcota bacterium]|nr:ArsA-related P-loop ATPase [Myxococcota bacterium]
EYAAVEMLYDVFSSNRFDLIVLDTPPSQNAIDFLEAPSKMLNFLEQSSTQWFLKPSAVAGRLSMKIFDVGSSIIAGTLGKMAGGETIRELSSFLVALSDLYDGFAERHEAVRSLLSSEDLGFVLVTSTQANQRAAMRRFRNDLAAGGFKTRGVIINRVRHVDYSTETLQAELDSAKLDLSTAELEALSQALDEEHLLARQDAKAIEALRAEIGTTPMIELPELPLDAHDLASLAALHTRFLEPGPSKS